MSVFGWAYPYFKGLLSSIFYDLQMNMLWVVLICSDMIWSVDSSTFYVNLSPVTWSGYPISNTDAITCNVKGLCWLAGELTLAWTHLLTPFPSNTGMQINLNCFGVECQHLNNPLLINSIHNSRQEILCKYLVAFLKTIF